MKKYLSLLLAVLMLLTFAACGQTTPVTEEKASDQIQNNGTATEGTNQEAGNETVEFTGEFKIGYWSDLNELDGQLIQKTVELYAKKVNEAGGLLGAKVVPVSYNNDQNSNENAVKIAQSLVSVDKINVCIPSQMSGNILAVGEILNNAKIPFYGIGLSPTWMAQGWDYAFRPTYNTDYCQPAMASAVKELGYSKVAIFEGQDDYGKTTSIAFQSAVEAEGGIEIVAIENYQSGVDTDFSGQIAKILAANPDCVYLSVVNGDSGNVMKQFRQFGYKGIFLYSEALRADMVEFTEGGSNYTLVAVPYVAPVSVESAPNEFTKEFLQMWVEEYGELPATNMAYKAWDACLSIDYGVKAANSLNGEDIQAAMNTLKFQALGGEFDYTGGTGECLFNINGMIFTDGLNASYIEDWMESDDYKEFVAQLEA